MGKPEVSLDLQGLRHFWLKMGWLVWNPQRAGDIEVFFCLILLFFHVTKERYRLHPPSLQYELGRRYIEEKENTFMNYYVL